MVADSTIEESVQDLGSYACSSSGSFRQGTVPSAHEIVGKLETNRLNSRISDKFDQLAHSILLYNPSYDDVFFVTRFLGGLKEEIRAPLILYRPPNLEVAGTLALLQEAELEASKSKAQPRSEFRDSYKGPVRGNARMDKSKFRKEEPKHVDTPNSASSDKLSALKTYRRANNLLFHLW